MATKTEERIQRIIYDAISKDKKEMEDQILTDFSGIFIMGMISGILLSYMSLIPIIIGLVSGIFIGKSKFQLTNYILLKIIYVLERGKFLVKNKL